MLVKDRYQHIVRDIMAEYAVRPTSFPDYMVPRSASISKVLQYTDYFVGKGNDTQPNAQPHYRYRRYLELLNGLRPSGRREVHVDLGCGAGLFSWVFLDWATAAGVGLERLDLYGLDHSPSMICLAQEIRARLLPDMPGYPELNYSHDLDLLLQKLKNNHREGTNYVITLGHVLAQTQTNAPADIKSFAQVIVHILKLMNGRSDCYLIAVDARSASIPFAEGWTSLLSNLESANISYEPHNVPPTSKINDCSCAKIAALYREQ